MKPIMYVDIVVSYAKRDKEANEDKRKKYYNTQNTHCVIMLLYYNILYVFVTVPLVSRVCPSDTYKVYKKGKTTLFIYNRFLHVDCS